MARWDETLIVRPEQDAPALNQIVNVRLDDIVYWIYRAQPAVFATFESNLEVLRRQLEEDRRTLRAQLAPPREHFIQAIRKHSAYNGIDLPDGREKEFAKWIYGDPARCPRLQLAHEVYRALMENIGDVPEASDFSDFAHVYALPYVQCATFDRRMRHYIRIGSERLLARGGVVNYSERVYENLAVFIGQKL